MLQGDAPLSPKPLVHTLPVYEHVYSLKKPCEILPWMNECTDNLLSEMHGPSIVGARCLGFHSRSARFLTFLHTTTSVNFQCPLCMH